MRRGRVLAEFPRRTTAVLAGAMLVAGLAACAPQSEPESETTLKMNLLNYMIDANWNPVTGNLNTYFASQKAVYESLIQLDGSTFTYEPLLAEEFTIADDQRSMHVKLREDVDFTDGTHLDAETAKASLDLLGTGAAFSWFFEKFGLEIEVLSEYELELTTDISMSSDFMFNFVIMPMASPTAIEEDPTGLETTPVGTGPYILDEQIPEVSISFVRNPDYRDPGAYAFDRLEFLVFEDPIAASNALKSGQLNVASLDPALALDAENNGFNVSAGGGASYLLVWMDPSGAVQPALADVRVRQAMAYALDRGAIKDSIDFGFGTDTSQAWGEGSPYYLEGGDDRYAYDLEKARDLMADAGYADGFDVSIPTFSLFAKYEPVITSALADIGIRVTFDQKADQPEWAAAGQSGTYALAIVQQADLFLANAIRPPIHPSGFPQLAEEFEVIDSGTLDEAAAAAQRIAEITLDEALVIAFARPLETWASAPEITVEVGIIQGWPPLLDAYHLVD